MPSTDLRTTLDQALRRRSVRALVALALVGLQFAVVLRLAQTRFDLPFNRSPGGAPTVSDAAGNASPLHWNRLPFARWDSQHYENLALLGYGSCPDRPLEPIRRPHSRMSCDLSFYPGYAWLGRLVSLNGLLPIDYTLLAISLVCSWIFLYLWTSATLIEPLGLSTVGLGLVAFIAFPSGFTLATVESEPLTLALTLGTWVALRQRHLGLAALLAGAASGARFTGALVSVAYCLALVWIARNERPLSWQTGLTRLAQGAASFWGVAATMVFFGVRFGDPLLYEHAHARAYGQDQLLSQALHLDGAWIQKAVENPLHEGAWLLAMVGFVAVGLPSIARAFAPPERLFIWALTILALAIPSLTSVQLGFVGCNRYDLLAIPAFFAIGRVLARRPVLLALWLAATAAHAWSRDLCVFVGDRTPETALRCFEAR